MMLSPVTEIFAFVVQFEQGEQVVGGQMPDGSVMPLVAADRRRMEELIPVAQSIADASGMTMVVARFGYREDERVIAPGE
jgi:hypothetical protein